LRRLARAFVAAVAVLVVVVAALQRLDGEPQGLLELAQLLPYPFLLVPAVLALVVSAALSWRWSAAALATVGVVLTLVMGLRVGSGEEGHGRLRVMTFNIKSYLVTDPGGFASIAWEVALHDPDVVVMQDAAELTSERAEKPQTASALFARRQVYAHGEYIVASRLPMRDCGPGDLSFPGHRREYVRCTVTAHGRDLDLYVAHFMTPRRGLSGAWREPGRAVDEWSENVVARIVQARKIASAIGTTGRPAVVAGDLNAMPHSRVMHTLELSGLRDAFDAAGRGYGHTYGHSMGPGLSFLRIDHVLVTRDLAVAGAYAGDAQASAHRPVIADLWVHPKGEGAAR
jgi:endonuclease/exonuclease/phosphatase (EEP) superfamily protein YafD